MFVFPWFDQVPVFGAGFYIKAQDYDGRNRPDDHKPGFLRLFVFQSSLMKFMRYWSDKAETGDQGCEAVARNTRLIANGQPHIHAIHVAGQRALGRKTRRQVVKFQLYQSKQKGETHAY